MEPSSPSPGFWGFPTITPPAAVRDSLGPLPQVSLTHSRAALPQEGGSGAHLRGLQSFPVSPPLSWPGGRLLCAWWVEQPKDKGPALVRGQRAAGS